MSSANTQELDVRRLKTDEVAERLKLTRQQVNNLIKAGVFREVEEVPTYAGDKVLYYRIPDYEVDRVAELRRQRGLDDS